MGASAEQDVNPAAARSEQSYDATPVIRTEHREGSFTRMVEHQAAKIPSDVFLFASLCSMATSLASELSGNKQVSRFVGMWAGPLLIMGIYVKLVKTLGPR